MENVTQTEKMLNEFPENGIFAFKNNIYGREFSPARG